ncbi:MAG: hypothetical protein RDV48_11240 [Candidatus Eremiobacteraeota bacterium]|nr:hypothetical protein [Candidatus Eremiobacteraeota bacterium]
MGFLDSLKEGAKKLADRVTGGYGKVEFEINKLDFRPGEEIQFTISIEATGELKAKRVLVHLHSQESTRVEVEVTKPEGTTQKEMKTYLETKNHEFEVHGPLEMKEGETKTITGRILIPGDCQPTFMGTHTTHEWTVEADVDVPMGKDLKSLKTITVR